MLTLGIIAYIVCGLSWMFLALYHKSKNDSYVDGGDVWAALLLFGVFWIVSVPGLALVYIFTHSADHIACKINQFVHNKGK